MVVTFQFLRLIQIIHQHHQRVIHLLQHEFLLQKSAFSIAKLRILKKMETGPGASYLASCGWSHHIQLLLFLALNLESSLRPEIYDWMGGSLRDSLYSSD